MASLGEEQTPQTSRRGSVGIMEKEQSWRPQVVRRRMLVGVPRHGGKGPQ